MTSLTGALVEWWNDREPDHGNGDSFLNYIHNITDTTPIGVYNNNQVPTLKFKCKEDQLVYELKYSSFDLETLYALWLLYSEPRSL